MSTDSRVVRLVARALIRDWKARPTRVLGAVASLLVCSMLFGLVFTLTGSIQNTLADGTGTNLRESALLVRSLDAGGLSGAELDIASNSEAVEMLSAASIVSTRQTGGGLNGNLIVIGSPTPEAFMPDGEPLPTREGTVTLTAPLANELALTTGDAISVNSPGGQVTWRIAGVRDHPMGFAVAEHNELLETWGKHNPADIAFLDTSNVAVAKSNLIEQLPATTLVGETEDLASTDVSTLLFIRVLLQIVTILTALLAGIAIFTAWRITLLDQSTNIARLRLAGVKTREIVVASGLIAAAAGLVLSLGGSTVGAISGQQLDAFVAQLAGVSGLAARPVAGPTAVPIALGTSVGLIVGVLGWYVGVRKIDTISLASATRPMSTAGTGQPRKIRTAGLALVTLTAIGLFTLSTKSVAAAGVAGLLAVAAALLAGYITPTVSGKIAGRTLREPSRTLTTRSLLSDRGHISTVATLIVLSVLLFVAISGTISSLVGGLETSVNAWTKADLYVEPALPGEYVRDEKFDAGLQAQIDGLDFVQDTGVFRLTRFDDGVRSVQIQSWSRDTAPAFVELAVEKGIEGPALWKEISTGHSVAVSVNYAALNGVSLGDTVTVPSVDGPRDFAVVATVVDFLADGGVVYTDAEIAAEITGDDRLNAVFVTVKPGTDLDEANEALANLSQATHPDSFVMTRQEMRDYVIGIGRQLLSMLLLIAIAACAMAVVASVALISTALTTRERSFALERMEGLTTKIQKRMVRREFLLVGLIAAAWGSLLGVIASHALGAAVEQSMGIRPEIAASPQLLLSGLAVGTMIPLIASFTSVRGLNSEGTSQLLRDDR